MRRCGQGLVGARRKQRSGGLNSMSLGSKGAARDKDPYQGGRKWWE
jgi:hypothetical protein